MKMEKDMVDIIQNPKSETKGHLLELDNWSEDVAREYASEDGMELAAEHMEVLHYLRKY